MFMRAGLTRGSELGPKATAGRGLIKTASGDDLQTTVEFSNPLYGKAYVTLRNNNGSTEAKIEGRGWERISKVWLQEGDQQPKAVSHTDFKRLTGHVQRHDDPNVRNTSMPLPSGWRGVGMVGGGADANE